MSTYLSLIFSGGYAEEAIPDMDGLLDKNSDREYNTSTSSESLKLRGESCPMNGDSIALASVSGAEYVFCGGDGPSGVLMIGERQLYAFGNHADCPALDGDFAAQLAEVAELYESKYSAASSGYVWRMTGRDGVAFSFDEAGNLIDDGNYKYEYSGDGLTVYKTGRLELQSDYTAVLEYDADGLLIRQSGEYGQSNTSTYTYQFSGDGAVSQRLESCVTPAGSPSYESVTTYEYDSGLLVREVETKTFARHSSEGRSPSSVATRVYSYDDGGNCSSMTEEFVSYTHPMWGGDVKTSTTSTTEEYSYGWVYAPAR